MYPSDQDGPYFLPLRGGPDRSRPSDGANSPRTVGNAGAKLNLARAARSRDGEWSADDYDALRATASVASTATGGPPAVVPTITALPGTQIAVAVSREQAMREFRSAPGKPSEI
jgi:hypothetical protein